MKTLRQWVTGALILAGAGALGPLGSTAFAAGAMAAGGQGGTPMESQTMGSMPGMHMHMTVPETTRRIVSYTLPPVHLVREDGKTVSLPDELNDGRPVVMTFIYTTCTEICPVISGTFAQLQSKLGADRDRVHLVSITIDPEHDTPARLAAYAKKFNAGPEWHHYSGTLAASVAVQKAFNVYYGDKMDHTPVAFLRSAPGQPWVRFDGFATADALMGELRGMLASR